MYAFKISETAEVGDVVGKVCQRSLGFVNSMIKTDEINRFKLWTLIKE